MTNVYLKSLFKIIISWGGVVKELSHEDYYNNKNILRAPFTNDNLGINWESKTLYYADKLPWWPEVIHEMGHLFGTNHHPDDNAINELDFFGWEYHLARKIRGPIRDWYKNNNDYQIDQIDYCGCANCLSAEYLYDEFGLLNKECQHRCIKRCTEAGIEKGIIKVNRYFKSGKLEYVPVPAR